MTFYSVVWSYELYELVKRPDTPSYYIYYRLPGRPTRRISTRSSDLHEAQQKLIAYANSRRQPSRLSSAEVSLSEALDGYVDAKLSGKAIKDAQSVLRVLKGFMAWAGVRTIAEMTPGMQREYIAWRRDRASKPLSTGTINKDLQVLRAALNHWKKEGFVADIPHVSLLPKPPPRERFLTLHEVGRLLAELREPHLYRFTVIALHTLQRPGAILDLRCEQVDLARRRIDFRPPGWIQSNKRRPVVPITDSLIPILEQCIAESRSGYVIEWDGLPVQRISQAFRRACKRAGLEGVSPYVLRHSGATLLAAAGVPMWQISGMMGHSNLVTTTQVYAKHAPEFLGEAARGIESVFGNLHRGAPTARQIQPHHQHQQLLPPMQKMVDCGAVIE